MHKLDFPLHSFCGTIFGTKVIFSPDSTVQFYLNFVDSKMGKILLLYEGVG